MGCGRSSRGSLEEREWVSEDRSPPRWVERDGGISGSHEKTVHGMPDESRESMGKPMARWHRTGGRTSPHDCARLSGLVKEHWKMARRPQELPMWGRWQISGAKNGGVC